MQKVIVTYHKDCIDGTAAAAVVLRKFPTARLFPLLHSYTQSDIGPILSLISPETEIYTVDCSLGIREFLMHEVKITTLDHHAGNMELLTLLASENPRYSYVFDNEKSAASLAWSYFFPDEQQPEIITYVEDADLWRWSYGEETKDVNNYLSMFWNDPKSMLELIEGDLSEIKAKGKVISMYADKQIEEQVTLASFNLKIGDHIVPAYNITAYQSACGNMLSEKLGKAVAMFTIKGNQVKISFRSKENQQPASLELAQLLEGGGHMNAAGATVSLQAFLSMVNN
jgi:oligoribonuclease NrnB/cAMP/cGMP phosphodiesterase (DHH superfamily)